MIQRGRFFWTGITKKGNEEGCGLLRSDLFIFILSLNLIGVAQRVPYIAHRIVRSDSGDILCCCFMKKSKGIYVWHLESVTYLWLSKTKWHYFFYFFSSVRHCGRFVNSQPPILFNVILSQCIVGIWSWTGGGAGQLVLVRVCCCEPALDMNTAGTRCGPAHTDTCSTCTHTPGSCTFPSAYRLFSCSNISLWLLLMLLLLR